MRTAWLPVRNFRTHGPSPLPLQFIRNLDWSNFKVEASARDAARLAAARDTKTMGFEEFAWEVTYYAAGAAAWKIVGAAKNAAHAASWASAWNHTEAGEYKEQVRLLRDILGNPFRSATLGPSWVTPDVITLAGHIYEDRAFCHLPELADSLIDAGCHNEEILSHCRSGGPHVRGCWVVDLLLGKE